MADNNTQDCEAGETHEICERCKKSTIQDITNYCELCKENVCEDCNGKYPESYDCGDSQYWHCRKCGMKMRETKCDVCGDTTGDAVRVIDENWEYCSGLDKQFCGVCRETREESPCEDPECQADMCYDTHNE